jgi:hypothetical protein
MTEDWNLFFPPGTRVLALPNWQQPRLYLPAQRFFGRWQASSLYPASRLRARLYRFLLRTKAAIRSMEVRTAQSSEWVLGKYVCDELPQATSVIVLVGLPSPIQKATAQLRDVEGRVLGYAKYSEKEAARRRLRQEHHMLSSITKGLGPEVLKHEVLEKGDLLLKTPILGRRPLATLPPIEGAVDYLTSLVVSPPVAVDDHPWVRNIREWGSEAGKLDTCFEALAGRRWPIVVQHGDFVPWNLIQRSENKIGAYDWEHGTLEGFPYLDLAYYVLQTSALVYRWAPAKAAQYVTAYLTSEAWPALDSTESWALTRLAAYDAYQKTLEDGQSASTYLQSWRRAIWEDAACDV